MKRDAINGGLALNAASIADARHSAKQTGRRVLSVLEESTALPPDAFVARLGDMLHYPTLTMAALNQLTPAFDLLPFADAVKRECVALRNTEGELLLGFADPFQSDIQAWADARIEAPAAWHLVQLRCD